MKRNVFRKRNVLISLILVIVWMGFIFFMSSMDAERSNSGSKAISNNVVSTIDKVASALPDSVEEPKETSFVDKVNIFIRKGSHGFEYLLLSILVLNLFFQMKKYSLVVHFYNLLFNFLYACTDEFHQTFVSGRTGQFKDVLIDLGGALIGCLVFFIMYKMVMKKVIMKIKKRRMAKRKVKMA